LRGPFLCQPSVFSLLDNHLLIGAVMPPAFVPAVIAMHAEFGARAEMMIAMFDHHRFGACNGRRGDGDRTSAAMT
jgi:hypothetical protein